MDKQKLMRKHYCNIGVLIKTSVRTYTLRPSTLKKKKIPKISFK